jgi:glycosyltransferase involved in cell wall biosynthesis
MIAVLMMYRNEEDIIGKCIKYWSDLGVDEFFLCSNLSTDNSHEIAVSTLVKCGKQGFHCAIAKEDFPQREAINYLKKAAIAHGHQWIFPIDADEFLNIGDAGFQNIQQWLLSLSESWTFGGFAYGQYRYLNRMPNGMTWIEPEHKKVFGKISPLWNISIGNHVIEGAEPTIPDGGAYLNHYQYRSYEQFKRKKLTFFKAFEKAGYLDHKFVKEYRLYQKHGEAYLEQMWDYLLRGVTEFEFKAHAQ